MKSFRRLRPTNQKIILLLAGGITLGLTRSPTQYFRIIKSIKKEWDWINEAELRRNIKKLYKSRIVDAKDNEGGSTTLILTSLGTHHALTYQIDEVIIPNMNRWDSRWRLVIFDIPEKFKKKRDALSKTFKRMGFYQLQKSVFIHPFECEKEVNFVVEFFNLRKFVHTILAERIDNDLELKRIFKL